MNIELEMPSYEMPQITGLTVALEPVQENDYDSVWPAGGGKNKFCDVFSEYTRPYDYRIFPITLAEGQYRIWASKTKDTVTGCTVGIAKSGNKYSDFDGLVLVMTTSGNANSTVLTVDSTWTDPKLCVFCSGEASFNSIFENYNIQLESGFTATSFAPYSNICPITGHSEVTATRTGKNLLDESSVVTYMGNQYFPVDVKKNTDYTFSTDSVITGLYFQYSDADTRPDTYGRWTTLFNRYNVTSVSGNSGSHKWYRLMTYEINGVTAGRKFQLELGSTATAYEPYQAQEYTIDLDGTIYGGTLDVLTGVLTVEWENIDSYAGETLPGEWMSDRDVYASGTTPTTGAQVVYKLATPTTVQLTAQDVETLTGINNVWSDSGDVSVTISGTTQTGDVVTVTALPQHKIQLFMP